MSNTCDDFDVSNCDSLDDAYNEGYNNGNIKGRKEGVRQAWKEMLEAVYDWNRYIQKTETSMEFGFFIKNKLKELKK